MNEVMVTSDAGENISNFKIRGINYPSNKVGWNFVTVDYSSFNNEHVPTAVNISSGFLCDRVADYIEKLPANTVVLAATAGNVTSGEKARS